MFALGATIYKALTLTVPTALSALGVEAGRPRRPSRLATGVSRDLDEAALAAADEYPNATMKAIRRRLPGRAGLVGGRADPVRLGPQVQRGRLRRGRCLVRRRARRSSWPPTTRACATVQAASPPRACGCCCWAGPARCRRPARCRPTSPQPHCRDLQRRHPPDAAETIDYFLRENVRPKVISGDNPVTVAAIAKRCGVPGADRYIDARQLPTDPAALAAAAEENAVFGRVTPEAKRALLHALQGRGEVVAMTGDGVNDTLALKDADLGIAMGSGTPAAKSVSELVLLDNRFATLPERRGRGPSGHRQHRARRPAVRHQERLGRGARHLTGICTMSYPILPRQLTVIDALTIGIPGFVLSFQPSHDPVRPGFIPRVLRFAHPGRRRHRHRRDGWCSGSASATWTTSPGGRARAGPRWR